MARLMPRVMPKSSALTMSLRTKVSVASKKMGRRGGPELLKLSLPHFAGAGLTSSVSIVMVMSSPTIELELPTPKSVRLTVVVADAPI